MRVVILKDIKRPMYREPFYARSAHVEYDAKAPRGKKQHALVFQQSNHFGTVGDCCDYLIHEELLQLERDGFVCIETRIHRRASRHSAARTTRNSSSA